MSIEQVVEERIKMINEFRPDYKIEKKSLITKKGFKTILINSEFEEQGIKLNTMKVFFIKGSDIFELLLLVEASKVDDYQEVFTRAMNSFEWIE